MKNETKRQSITYIYCILWGGGSIKFYNTFVAVLKQKSNESANKNKKKSFWPAMHR